MEGFYLTLIRHSYAESAKQGERDFDRPLSKKGHYTADVLARQLHRNSLLPVDSIIASPALRTLTTANYLAKETSAPVTTEQILYDGNTADYLNLIRSLPANLHHVVFVAHNPHISYTASHLFPGLEKGFSPGQGIQLLATTQDWSDVEQAQKRLIRLFTPDEHEKI